MAISLSSISKTTRANLPPRIIVHGAEKVGKSTFGASSYNPIFLPLEDGLDGIETNAFPQLKSFDEVLAAIDSLAKEPHDFGTAVIDSLDWLEPLIWTHAAARNGWPNIEAPGYGKGYIEANDDWRRLFSALNGLRMNRGMAIVLIAHSRIKRFDAPDQEGFDRYELKLQAGALGLAVEWADIIGFAQEETFTQKEDAGFNKKRTRAIGTGNRVLRVNAKPAFIAGNRYGMPDTIPLSWNDLVAAMSPTQAEPAANTSEAAPEAAAAA